MAHRQLLYSLLTLGMMILMVLAAELSGEREIIFPEVTAIAVGLFLAPKQSWVVSKPRLFFLITFCAWAGLAISLWMPGPQWGKLCAAFLLCQLVLAYSGTGFAPLISAGVLPEHITVGGVCTMCESDLLFSHRKTRGRRGSNCAMLALAGAR